MKLLHFYLPLFFLSQLSFAQNTVVIKDTNLRGNTTYNWTKNNVYLLDGYVYLESGGRLNIEAGTIIKAKAVPSTGDPASALIISRGAKIYANGTKENPIIFTAQFDNLSNPTDLGKEDVNLWEGLFVFGYGIVNTDNGQPAYLPNIYDDQERHVYGGSNDADNSGRLKYISVRHAYAGLTLGAVGSQTSIDHVEVYATDWGMQIWGGKVDAKYCSVNYARKHAFSLADGWQGRGQFWFSVQDEEAYGSAVKVYGYNATDYFYVPFPCPPCPEPQARPARYTKPTIYNGTFIGSGKDSYNSYSNSYTALTFTGGGGGIVANSIFIDFPGFGINIADFEGTDSYDRLLSGNLKILNNIWGKFGEGNQLNAGSNGIIYTDEYFEHPNPQALINHLNSNDNVTSGDVDVVLKSDPDFKNYFLDPRKNRSGEILAGTLPESSADYPDNPFYEIPDGCTLVGGFIMEEYWVKDWTGVADEGYLYDNVYVLYNNKLFQKDYILIHCSEFEDFKKNFTAYDPICLLPPVDPGGLGLSSNRKSRSQKSIRTNPLHPSCIIEKEFQFTFDAPRSYGSEIVTVDALLFIQDECSPVARIMPPPGTGNQSWPYNYISIQHSDEDTSFITLPTITGNSITWRIYDRCMSTLDVSLTLLYDNSAYETYYADFDRDGYGDPNTSIRWSVRPPSYVTNNLDCDDTDPLVRPGRAEIPGNATDENCDGVIESGVCESDEIGIYVATHTTSNSESELVHAQGRLYSSAIIFEDTKVIFRSDTEIILQPGFAADAGSNFTAQIQPCPSTLTDGGLDTRSSDSTSLTPVNKAFRLSCYPNPVSSMAKITVQLPKQTKVVLQLHDLQGKVIKEIISGNILTAGPHELEVSVADIGSGIYFLNLHTEEQSQIQKIVVITNGR